MLDLKFTFIRFLHYDSRSTPLRGDLATTPLHSNLTAMETVKDIQTEIGDADSVSEQSSNPEYNVAHVSFENITHTSKHHDDLSASHTKMEKIQPSKAIRSH